jgi:hypothetical protein
LIRTIPNSVYIHLQKKAIVTFSDGQAQVREIFLRVRENLLTVLYEQSGLGKDIAFARFAT